MCFFFLILIFLQACNDATENLNRKQQIKLYSYFKSTSSCRVRIALNLKGVIFHACFLKFLVLLLDFVELYDFLDCSYVLGVPHLL